jgi:hypothetical protein
MILILGLTMYQIIMWWRLQTLTRISSKLPYCSTDVVFMHKDAKTISIFLWNNDLGKIFNLRKIHFILNSD